MSILVGRGTRLLVQGITGREASYHAARCREYGANLVGRRYAGQGRSTVRWGCASVRLCRTGGR